MTEYVIGYSYLTDTATIIDISGEQRTRAENLGRCQLGCYTRMGDHFFAKISDEKFIDVYEARASGFKRLFRSKPLPEQDFASTIASSISGSFLAIGSRKGSIYIWMPFNSGKLLGNGQHHFKSVTTIAFNDNETVLASGSADCSVCIWNTCSFSKGTPVATVAGHTLPITSAVFTQGGFSGYLFTSSLDSSVRIVDMSTFSVISSVSFNSPVMKIAFGLPESIMLCGCQDGTISILKSEDSGVGSRERISSHQGPITSIMQANNGRLIISASQDGEVKIWDNNSRQLHRCIADNVIESGIIVVSSDMDRNQARPQPLLKYIQEVAADAALEIRNERNLQFMSPEDFSYAERRQDIFSMNDARQSAVEDYEKQRLEYQRIENINIGVMRMLGLGVGESAQM